MISQYTYKMEMLVREINAGIRMQGHIERKNKSMLEEVKNCITMLKYEHHVSVTLSYEDGIVKTEMYNL